MMQRARILLADDHAVLRDGLVRLLEVEFDVVGAVGDGRELVTEALRQQPDVALLDIGMPILNGIEAARQLNEQAPEIRLVFLTQQTEKEYVQAAFAAGARGYVLKNAAAEELLEAVRQVMRGNRFLSPLLGQRYPVGQFGADAAYAAEPFGSTLTSRQREVLQLVAEGMSAKEIAHLLGISVKTVEFHKARIMEELGLRTTAELTRYAIGHGILQR